MSTAAEAVRRVRELHSPVNRIYANAPDIALCVHCSSGGDPYCYPEGAERYPCPTIRVLDGELDGEA